MAKRTEGEDAPTLSADDKFELLIAALTARQGETLTKDALEDILTRTAQVSATSMQRALKPENQDHPGVSVFSYPEGDKARPRPTLPFRFFYNNFPVHKFPETHHWRELELASQLEPGTFTVLRKDGSPMQVEVTADRDPKGVITEIKVAFSVAREHKDHIPAMSVVLYQLAHKGDHPRKRFVEAMQEHLRLLFEDSAAAAV